MKIRQPIIYLAAWVISCLLILSCQVQPTQPTVTAPTNPPTEEPAATQETAAPVDPVFSMVWALSRYINLDGAAVKPVEGSQVTLSLLEDGSFVGNAGCNRYGGKYAVKGEKLTIDPNIVVTEMACLAPPGVMEQEARYLELLPTASRIKMVGIQLVMYNADDAPILEFGKEIEQE
jgi:heat shock protein HslJ